MILRVTAAIVGAMAALFVACSASTPYVESPGESPRSLAAAASMTVEQERLVESARAAAAQRAAEARVAPAPSLPEQVQPRVAAPAPLTSNCDPSYEGVCIPLDTYDADCAGGGGNGPFYVTRTVRVVGPDVFELDRDGDGLACDLN